MKMWNSLIYVFQIEGYLKLFHVLKKTINKIISEIILSKYLNFLF